MAVTGILGKKIGMTQVFDDKGDVHAITVLQVGPCVVTQLKTVAKDGYVAAQIGLVEFVKQKNVTKPQAGHFAKTEAPPVKVIREVDVEAGHRWRRPRTKAGDRVLVKADIFADAKVRRRDRHFEGPRFCWRCAQARIRRRTLSRTVTCSRCRARSARVEAFPSRVFPGQRMRRPTWPGAEQRDGKRNLQAFAGGIDLDENLLMVEGAGAWIT